MKHVMLTTCLLTTLVVQMGCSTPSLSQVSAFGAASTSLADHSKKAFALVDSATVERKLYDLALNTEQPLNDRAFQGLFTGTQAENLAIRIKLLGKLGDYADALAKLASADVRKDIDMAAKEFDSALVGLSQSYAQASGMTFPLGDEQLHLISSIVDGIGGAIVEHKRRKAVKEIVVAADDAIQATCALLAKEFGDNSDLARYVAESLSNANGTLRQAYNSQFLSKDISFASRYQMLVKIRKHFDAANAVQVFFKNVSDGTKKVGESHTALKHAATKGSFTSVEIVKSIGELVEYAESVKTFYNDVAKSE